MTLELIRDLVRVDQIVGKGMTQAVVEGDVVVPDNKPDADRILSINGDVVIIDKEIAEDIVTVEGVINVKVLYISREGERSLYYMEGSFGFNEQLDLPNVKSWMDTEVKAIIEHIDSSMINSRKLNVKCVLDFSGKVIERSQIDVIKDIEGIDDVQVLRGYLKTKDTIGGDVSRVTVKQDFVIPDDKPAIKEILYTDIILGERDSSVLEGKIALNGILMVTTLYIDADSGSVNDIKYELPFSHYMEIPGAIPGMEKKVWCYVEDFYSTVKGGEGEQKQSIEYEAVVKMGGKVETTQPVEVLEDAYSPTVNLETVKSKVYFKKTLDGIKEDIIIKEDIDLPAGLPPIKDICDIKVKPLLTDFGIHEDQVVVEGILAIQVLYLTDAHTQAVHLYEEEIPFSHSVPLPEMISDSDSDSDIDLDVELYPTDLQYRVLDGDLFEFRGRVKADIAMEQTLEKEVLLDAEEVEPAKEATESSLVVYFIRPGDHLWGIAKRFNTTVEDLIKINEIDEPDVLVPGDRLIISRVVKFQLSSKG